MIESSAQEINELKVDENSPFFDTEGMKYKEFLSNYEAIRNYATIIAFDAPEEFRDGNLLEQQISEIIKNAVKHGNKCDKTKLIKIWYDFDTLTKIGRIIVEDEGEGFKSLDKWNKFNRKRMECYLNGNFDDMIKYLSYKTEDSTELDGGNSLFAAVEYWNKGMIYNNKKNKVVAIRKFD